MPPVHWVVASICLRGITNFPGKKQPKVDMLHPELKNSTVRQLQVCKVLRPSNVKRIFTEIFVCLTMVCEGSADHHNAMLGID